MWARRRGATFALAAGLALTPALAGCAEEDAPNVEQELEEGGEQVEEGVEQGGEEVEEEVDN